MPVLASDNQLLELIPQRPPMVMIHRLMECATDRARTEFDVQRECIFCQGGALREPGMIENMAQTAAAWAGYLSREAGKDRPLGFIGMVQNFELKELPQEGQILQTQLQVTHQIMNATVVRGEIRVDGKLLAEGEMKIFDQSV